MKIHEAVLGDIHVKWIKEDLRKSAELAIDLKKPEVFTRAFKIVKCIFPKLGYDLIDWIYDVACGRKKADWEEYQRMIESGIDF